MNKNLIGAQTEGLIEALLDNEKKVELKSNQESA